MFPFKKSVFTLNVFTASRQVCSLYTAQLHSDIWMRQLHLWLNLYQRGQDCAWVNTSVRN